MKQFYVFIACILISSACTKHLQVLTNTAEKKHYTITTNRIAAEWEPAIGTMVVWPLAVPYKLVVELSNDNHLYTLVVNDSTMHDAQRWYTTWGIDPNRNTFVIAPQGIDSWWTRDWGPSAVFTKEGTMKLGDGKYIFSTPASSIGCTDSLRFLYQGSNKEIIKTEIDDNATVPLGKGLQVEVLDLPFITTGGNVMTDGLGTAFSTCILLNENKYFTILPTKFFDLNKELLGIQDYHILSNFEKYGIQHIDCFMKIVDEERILVAEPPIDHALYPIYENIVQNELKKIKTFYGRPYEIIRLKTGRYQGEDLAAYTNSIIVNKNIYVPLFQIKEDAEAIKTWQNTMPGYTVKGFDFVLKDEPVLSKEMKNHYKTGYGWTEGDALHCRTRAVWDKDMLFISVKSIDKTVSVKHKNIVYASIIDYSGLGLLKNKVQLYWRVVGESTWRQNNLRITNNPNQFYYTIPYHKKGAIIEYFVSVASKSGRIETQPKTAPHRLYQFRIE